MVKNLKADRGFLLEQLLPQPFFVSTIKTKQMATQYIKHVKKNNFHEPQETLEHRPFCQNATTPIFLWNFEFFVKTPTPTPTPTPTFNCGLQTPI